MSDILSVTGALILFFAWMAQQFLYEAWRARLGEINEARRAFAVYQSHNALFDAIAQITPSDQRARLWELQTKNYHFGLDLLRQSLSREQLQSEIEEEKARLVRTGFPKQYAEMQAEIIVMQVEHNREKELIAARKGVAQKIFWALYILGSLVVIAGQLLKQIS